MTDRWNVRLVIIFLGGFALLVGAGAIFLADGSHDVPAPLWTLAGTAVGAVGSILTSTRSEPAMPTPVQVMNEPVDAVPVAEAPKPKTTRR